MFTTSLQVYHLSKYILSNQKILRSNVKIFTGILLVADSSHCRNHMTIRKYVKIFCVYNFSFFLYKIVEIIYGNNIILFYD